MLLPFVSSAVKGVFEQVPCNGVVQAGLVGLVPLTRKSGSPRVDERSPLRCAAEGTAGSAEVAPREMRRCSSEKKKKVLFFPLFHHLPPSPKLRNGSGPPRVPPKLL